MRAAPGSSARPVDCQPAALPHGAWEGAGRRHCGPSVAVTGVDGQQATCRQHIVPCQTGSLERLFWHGLHFADKPLPASPVAGLESAERGRRGGTVEAFFYLSSCPWGVYINRCVPHHI